MTVRSKQLWCAVAFSAALFHAPALRVEAAAVRSTPSPHAAAAAAAAQCPGTDVSVRKQLRFGRGRTTTVVRDRIKLCTSHDYYFRARRGQRMSVRLVAGKKTSFAVYAPTDRISDGVWNWAGELPEDGEYQINIGTDVTARYTLQVTIR